MRDPDFYKVLGLTKRATAADIRKAYKKKALETHPDKNPGRNTEDAFKAVGEAYATLSDEARRKDYDAALAGGGASSRGSSRGGAEGFATRPAPGFDPSFGESGRSDESFGERLWYTSLFLWDRSDCVTNWK